MLLCRCNKKVPRGPRGIVPAVRKRKHERPWRTLLECLRLHLHFHPFSSSLTSRPSLVRPTPHHSSSNTPLGPRRSTVTLLRNYNSTEALHRPSSTASIHTHASLTSHHVANTLNRHTFAPPSPWHQQSDPFPPRCILLYSGPAIKSIYPSHLVARRHALPQSLIRPYHAPGGDPQSI